MIYCLYFVDCSEIAFRDGRGRRSVVGLHYVYELYGVYPGEAQASALWRYGKFFEKRRAGIACIYPTVDNAHGRKIDEHIQI